jgi:uncharacterized protein (DUF3820 family)
MLNRTSQMPYGEYVNTPMCEIPNKYLLQLYDNGNLKHADVKRYIETHVLSVKPDIPIEIVRQQILIYISEALQECNRMANIRNALLFHLGKINALSYIAKLIGISDEQIKNEIIKADN